MSKIHRSNINTGVPLAYFQQAARQQKFHGFVSQIFIFEHANAVYSSSTATQCGNAPISLITRAVYRHKLQFSAEEEACQAFRASIWSGDILVERKRLPKV